MFPFPVSYISFQAADGYWCPFLRQCAYLLTLCLLGTDPSKNARQGFFALQCTHCLRHIVIVQCFNEVRDVYIDRAAADAWFLGALNTAVCFLKGHFMRVSQSHLVEVSGP